MEDEFGKSVSMEKQYEKTLNQRNMLIKYLQEIHSIEDKMDGGDWDEIEEAREIAYEALKSVGVK